MTIERELTHNLREVLGEGENQNQKASQCDYTLAATTGDTYSGSIVDTNSKEVLSEAGQRAAEKEDIPTRRRRTWPNGDESNCFRSAQWTADGRYLVTNSEDSGVRIFGLPSEWSESVDVLDPNIIPHLKPYSIIHQPESVYSIGTCPWVLEDPSLNWFITCARDSPLHLYSLNGKVLSTFILQHASTERYLSPFSITFSRQDTHFICGTESMISVFDLNRREPVYNLRTIPSRKHTYTTQTMKGIISAMDISPDRGILAAGTFSRSVGLYDQEGSGDVVSIFSLAEEWEGASSSLKGVTDVKWSYCGTYLYVSERKDDKITVWDMRKLYGKVATLTGRNAYTVQRLGIDMSPGERGNEVILGGGMDGNIKIWDAHTETSSIGEWEAHADPVVSVAVNPAWPGLVASCSGQRNHSRRCFGEESRSQGMDNSLKLWKYAGQFSTESTELEPYPTDDNVVSSDTTEGIVEIDTMVDANITETADTTELLVKEAPATATLLDDGASSTQNN